ncbi:MAG: cytochrome b [Legionellales bacterium]|nr:cytochrome b [Legionellales bacterium]
MALRNTPESYGVLAKFFHWSVSSLIILMLIAGFIMVNLDNTPMQSTVYFFHKAFGLLILGLVVLRIVWTLSNPKPRLPAKLPMPLKIVAHLSHLLLYLAILAMPICGLLLSTYAGHPPSFFGLFTVTLPLAKDKALAELFGNLHSVFAFVIIGLLVLHVSAALVHHFIFKDNTLKRMAPCGEKCK